MTEDTGQRLSMFLDKEERSRYKQLQKYHEERLLLILVVIVVPIMICGMLAFFWPEVLAIVPVYEAESCRIHAN